MKYLWYPLVGLKWLALKARTFASQCTAARAKARAKLVASTSTRIGKYEDHISGSRGTTH